MNIERWDILNGQGYRTGRTTLRGGGLLKPGEYHLVVHIWILSSDGRFLIQRRAEDKKLMPGEWAATGGAAIAGEDSYTAARRELFEELGIRSDRNTLKKILRIKRKNSLLDVWLTTTNLSVSELSLQKSEVAEAKWITSGTLSHMIESGMFHNYGREYFESILSKIEEYRGAVR